MWNLDYSNVASSHLCDYKHLGLTGLCCLCYVVYELFKPVGIDSKFTSRENKAYKGVQYRGTNKGGKNKQQYRRIVGSRSAVQVGETRYRILNQQKRQKVVNGLNRDKRYHSRNTNDLASEGRKGPLFKLHGRSTETGIRCVRWASPARLGT